MRDLDHTLGLSSLAGFLIAKDRGLKYIVLSMNSFRPASGVSASVDVARDEQHLLRGQNQATLLSSGRPLGECRFKSLAQEP